MQSVNQSGSSSSNWGQRNSRSSSAAPRQSADHIHLMQVKAPTFAAALTPKRSSQLNNGQASFFQGDFAGQQQYLQQTIQPQVEHPKQQKQQQQQQQTQQQVIYHSFSEVPATSTGLAATTTAIHHYQSIPYLNQVEKSYHANNSTASSSNLNLSTDDQQLQKQQSHFMLSRHQSQAGLSQTAQAYYPFGSVNQLSNQPSNSNSQRMNGSERLPHFLEQSEKTENVDEYNSLIPRKEFTNTTLQGLFAASQSKGRLSQMPSIQVEKTDNPPPPQPPPRLATNSYMNLQRKIDHSPFRQNNDAFQPINTTVVKNKISFHPISSSVNSPVSDKRQNKFADTSTTRQRWNATDKEDSPYKKLALKHYENVTTSPLLPQEKDNVIVPPPLPPATSFASTAAADTHEDYSQDYRQAKLKIPSVSQGVVVIGGIKIKTVLVVGEDTRDSTSTTAVSVTNSLPAAEETVQKIPQSVVESNRSSNATNYNDADESWIPNNNKKLTYDAINISAVSPRALISIREIQRAWKSPLLPACHLTSEQLSEYQDVFSELFTSSRNRRY